MELGQGRPLRPSAQPATREIRVNLGGKGLRDGPDGVRWFGAYGRAVIFFLSLIFTVSTR